MERYIRFASAVILFLVFSVPAWCASPSELNGLGAVVEDNFGVSRGMGGAGIADDGGWNMLQSNPAVSMTFKNPAYAIGMLYNNTNLSTGSGSFKYGGTHPNMIRFVLPFYGKVACAWELSPFTRTDGKLQLSSNPGDTWTDTIKSSGGINQSSLELSTNVKKISVGIGFNYYFGAIEEKWFRDFHDADDMTNTTDYLRKEYKGYGMTLGLLAKAPLKTTVGFGYSTKAKLDRTVNLKLRSYDNDDILLENGKTDIPSRWRIGVTKDFSRKLTAAADFSQAFWSDAARTQKEKQQYQDTYTFSAGMRYIPALNSTASYLSTIPLSLGFRIGNQYYKSYPKIESIPERAITLGLEFPFKEKQGSLITSYEFGKRGSKSTNGWDETFFIVGITLVGSIK